MRSAKVTGEADWAVSGRQAIARTGRSSDQSWQHWSVSMPQPGHCSYPRGQLSLPHGAGPTKRPAPEHRTAHAATRAARAGVELPCTIPHGVHVIRSRRVYWRKTRFRAQDSALK